MEIELIFIGIGNRDYFIMEHLYDSMTIPIDAGLTYNSLFETMKTLCTNWSQNKIDAINEWIEHNKAANNERLHVLDNVITNDKGMFAYFDFKPTK